MSVHVEVSGHALEVVEPLDLLWPAGGQSAVALCTVKTAVEQRIFRTWVDAQKTAQGRLVRACASAAEVVDVAVPGQLIIPVRVVWLPGDDHRRRRDVIADSAGGWLLNRAQESALSRNPQSCRVLIGEPALLSELQARWSERSGESGAFGAEFAAFVERQASITLDRAERRLRGDRYRAPRAVVEEVMTSAGFPQGVEVPQRQARPEPGRGAR